MRILFDVPTEADAARLAKARADYLTARQDIELHEWAGWVKELIK